MAVAEADVALRLSRDLDIPTLARDFAGRGRALVTDILEPRSAGALEAALLAERGWSRSVRVASATFSAPLDGRDPIDPRHVRWLAEARPDPNSEAMQWVFDARRFTNERRMGLGRGDLLDAFHDFVNSEAFLAFGRTITGDPEPARCEMQATRYRPGDFLTPHSDRDPAGARLYAFVFNLSRDWRPGWGGQLMFHDRPDRTDEAFTPAFNSFSLFRVPMTHSVSQVADFAPRDRLAVSGWFLRA